jgi:hypothetical protein
VGTLGAGKSEKLRVSVTARGVAAGHRVRVVLAAAGTATSTASAGSEFTTKAPPSPAPLPTPTPAAPSPAALLTPTKTPKPATLASRHHSHPAATATAASSAASQSRSAAPRHPSAADSDLASPPGPLHDAALGALAAAFAALASGGFVVGRRQLARAARIPKHSSRPVRGSGSRTAQHRRPDF